MGEIENDRKIPEMYGTNDFWEIGRIDGSIGKSDTHFNIRDPRSSPNNRVQIPSPDVCASTGIIGPQVEQPVSTNRRVTISMPQRVLVRVPPYDVLERETVGSARKQELRRISRRYTGSAKNIQR